MFATYLTYPCIYLLLCVFIYMYIECKDCVLHIEDLNNCAKLAGVNRIPEKYEGFGFGFGSIGDVEQMCRTRWHIKVYSCAQLTILSRCSRESTSHFRNVMWQFIFDTTPYEKAANYLCQHYNLRIFRYHRDKCLSVYESQVENCSKQYSNLLSETYFQLSNSNPVNSRNPDEYANYMKSVLSSTYCSGTITKVNCIKQILEKHCSSDVIELIQNYFRETLPSGCEQNVNISKKFMLNIMNKINQTDLIMNDYRNIFTEDNYSNEIKFNETNEQINNFHYNQLNNIKTVKRRQYTNINSTSVVSVMNSKNVNNNCNKLINNIIIMYLLIVIFIGLQCEFNV
ncbi:Peptidase S1 S6 chymotrypsin Hap active site [Schistosoma japonicum]|uniref:Peptidase S1 S6 chymotrypsin Hap active site n=1 Tax=Schistosoma japonicum TaxID=6182 RepID=A0A4Z2DNL6_SCHJA|nr:Peptidase S1 S6 chymotrypsin Hap active site [Schistosoma japonicum]